MDEFIEKKKLVNRLKMWLMDLENDMDKGEYGELCENKGAREAVESFICEVEEQPASDVRPVKHGHWYDNTYRYVGELDAYFIQACCSCCNRYSDRIDQYTKIMSNETCSHCGAEMGDYNDVVRSCETCNHYNVNTCWCSRYNDTTYSSNCSSYQVKE